MGPIPSSRIFKCKLCSELRCREFAKYRPLGVTGLAQVHGLRDQHSSEDKARFDLQYIFNWSPLFDLSLILQTVWTLLSRGLSQEPDVSHAPSFRSESNDYVTREVADVNRP